MTEPGITKAHRAACPAHANAKARCRCTPRWRAFVHHRAGGRKTFDAQSEARAWKRDMEQRGKVARRPYGYVPKVAEAADELIDGMRSGAIRNRSDDVYKASVIADYEQALAAHIRPVLGARPLDQVERRHVMHLAEELQRRSLSPSRIRNVLMPLRVIYRRANDLEQMTGSPLDRLRLPAVRGQRDRIVEPDEAERMLAALTGTDRVVWALAFYGGLRRGEARGLRWSDIDFDAGVIHVKRAWCNRSRQMTLPKSRAGVRRVPMAGRLRQLLLEHRLLAGRPADGDLIATGRKPGVPISASTLSKHARDTWATLDGIPGDFGLHEARHTYASLMIAAGCGPREIMEFMGHSSITTTLDLYGHLFPGAHAEAAGKLDRLLDRAASTTASTTEARQPLG